MQRNVVVTTPGHVDRPDRARRAQARAQHHLDLQDQMLADIITRVSAEIAAYCNNRVFGYETVVETFTEMPVDNNRLYLARFPVPQTRPI